MSESIKVLFSSTKEFLLKHKFLAFLLLFVASVIPYNTVNDPNVNILVTVIMIIILMFSFAFPVRNFSKLSESVFSYTKEKLNKDVADILRKALVSENLFWWTFILFASSSFINILDFSENVWYYLNITFFLSEFSSLFCILFGSQALTYHRDYISVSSENIIEKMESSMNKGDEK